MGRMVMDPPRSSRRSLWLMTIKVCPVVVAVCMILPTGTRRKEVEYRVTITTQDSMVWLCAIEISCLFVFRGSTWGS